MTDEAKTEVTQTETPTPTEPENPRQSKAFDGIRTENRKLQEEIAAMRAQIEEHNNSEDERKKAAEQKKLEL